MAVLSMIAATAISTLIGVGINEIVNAVEAAETEKDGELIQALNQVAGHISNLNQGVGDAKAQAESIINRLRSASHGLSGQRAANTIQRIVSAASARADELQKRINSLSAQQQAAQTAGYDYTGLGLKKQRTENRDALTKQQEAINEGLRQAETELQQVQKSIQQYR